MSGNHTEYDENSGTYFDDESNGSGSYDYIKPDDMSTAETTERVTINDEILDSTKQMEQVIHSFGSMSNILSIRTLTKVPSRQAPLIPVQV